MARRDPRHRSPSGKKIILTERDHAILCAHLAIRYIRSTWLIAAFPDADHTSLLKRLGDLFHEIPCLSRPKEQFRYNLTGPVTHPIITEIDPYGTQVLKHQGIVPFSADLQMGRSEDHLYFHHAVMICDILLSAFISDLDFISSAEIIQKAPCKDLKHPVSIPITIDGKSRRVVPDGLFGFNYGEKGYRFFAVEADRGNMSHKRFLAKMAGYLHILQHQTYKTHYGIQSNLLVLVVTTDDRRKATMIKNVLDLTKGKGNANILFKTMRGNVLDGPPPTGHIVFEDWERAGYGPFNISVP